MKKTTIILLCAIMVIACAESKKETSTTIPATSTTSNDSDLEADEEAAEEVSGIIDGVNAEQIFKQSCSVCHGLDGKLGANGSKDLTQSVLTIDEKISIITAGKGVMTAFGEILEANEIAAVAKYTEQLKK
jgi:mono/diheme cytochrome c family protein